MPDPTIPYTLIITAGSNSTAGMVTVEDITQFDTTNPEKNKIRIELDTNKKATVDLANLRSGYSNGDEILINLTGIRSGFKTHKVDTSKGSAKITLTESSADYAGSSINL